MVKNSNLGDYVIWNNQYWLITLLDPDEKPGTEDICIFVQCH